MDNVITEITPASEDLSRINLIKNALKNDWPEYFKLITSLTTNHQLAASLKLLNVADHLLNQNMDLAASNVSERYLLGGVQDTQTNKNYPFNIQLLGDMQNFASFKKSLKNDAAGLAKLMKIIPKAGPIDGWHFMQFIDSYQQWFADNGFKQCHLFPATRLLSMKRPDQFFVLDESTNETICQAFGIKPLKKHEFQRYWDDLILPTQKTLWFKAFQPLDESQLPFFRVRVALLERLAATPLSDEQLLSEQQVIPSEAINILPAIDSAQSLQRQPISTVSQQFTQTPSLPSTPSISMLGAERPIAIKKAVVQPKKMTIAKLKSTAGNKAAATKLMSQYYFANKLKFIKVDLSKHRESIIQQLVDGESVETIFEALLR